MLKGSTFFTGYKRVRKFSLSAETVRHIWLPLRLSVISCFLPSLPSTKYGFLQRLSEQEDINRAQQSRQEARDHGQSQWKPNMTDSLCRKRKLADSFIRNPGRDISFPIFIRQEIETRKLERKSKQKISRLIDLLYRLNDVVGR